MTLQSTSLQFNVEHRASDHPAPDAACLRRWHSHAHDIHQLRHFHLLQCKQLNDAMLTTLRISTQLQRIANSSGIKKTFFNTSN